MSRVYIGGRKAFPFAQKASLNLCNAFRELGSVFIPGVVFNPQHPDLGNFVLQSIHIFSIE